MIFIHCPTFSLVNDPFFMESLQKKFPHEEVLECSFPKYTFDNITVRSGTKEYSLSDKDTLILECKSMSFWTSFIPRFKGLLLTVTFDNKHKTIRLREVLKTRLILKDFLNVYIPKTLK